MKKISVICLIIISVLCSPVYASAAGPVKDAREGLSYEYTPSEGSVEELYKDIIVTLMEPYITREVEKYYGQKLQYDLFDIRFLKIDRPQYRSFSFLVKLKIRPFTGAHNTVGEDNITMLVSPLGTRVIKFEHTGAYITYSNILLHLNKFLIIIYHNIW